MMRRTGCNDYYLAALSWVDVCFAISSLALIDTLYSDGEPL
jgi:hypothetical protein